jgi:hypothetical protein
MATSTPVIPSAAASVLRTCRLPRRSLPFVTLRRKATQRPSHFGLKQMQDFELKQMQARVITLGLPDGRKSMSRTLYWPPSASFQVPPSQQGQPIV